VTLEIIGVPIDEASQNLLSQAEIDLAYLAMRDPYTVSLPQLVTEHDTLEARVTILERIVTRSLERLVDG
jgi:hypothetical protein